MDSSLTPRDIQARLRAGESVEAVAQAAGVTPDRLDAFAAPVMAERDHVAALAQMNPVRRRGETTSNRPLRTAASEFLAGRGIDWDAATWDAWKVEGRRWQIAFAWPAGDETDRALFLYDQQGRFSVAADEGARRVLGDAAPPPSGPHDDLALVLAVQSPDAEEEPPTAPSGSDADDAFTEGELAEVDGVYDIVADPNEPMDALYDMLSSFDEDSVKIYAGLVHPDEPYEDTGVIVDAEPAPDAPLAPAPAPDHEDTRPLTPPAEPAPEPEPEPAAESRPPTAAPAGPAEPEQPSLIEDAEPAPRPRKRPKRRASVPSWDEIMFGSPRQSE